MLFCTLFTASGQLFFKYSSEKFQWNFMSLITNYNLLLGLFLYGIGAALFILALKFGDLSATYPLVSLTFIWVMLISSVILKENINGFKISAIVFIIIGVVAITKGDKNNYYQQSNKTNDIILGDKK
ncbi:EamA family transporter [Candidatus Woesearchaeota archaeon]|nr:EamA family transporter [Candidatus Woesearchaeota archaeon]